MSNGETFDHNIDKNVETNAAEDQLERAGNKLSSSETIKESAETRAERAKSEALETAISVDKKSESEKEGSSRHKAVRRGALSKKELNGSYKRTMKRVQGEMSTPSKTFSQFIHNPLVEKTSEIVGSTVARPNAILSGSICAFILTLSVYLISKNVGYVMSGFETIASFAVGWIIGLGYDYMKLLITGKKS